MRSKRSNPKRNLRRNSRKRALRMPHGFAGFE